MRLRIDRARLRTASYAAAAALALPISTQAPGQVARQINLVTNDNAFLVSQGFAPANTVDPNLVNPWGMSFSATSPFWISNQVTGTTTLYDGNGTPFPPATPLVVDIPSAPGAGPTGQAFIGGQGFQLTGGAGAASFAFANLDGSISAWNFSQGTTAPVQVSTPGAVYTGLAAGSSGGSNFLFAANNAAGTIDVFDQNFQPVITLGPGAFTDPNLPSGLSPFNVVNIGGKLFVTYAAGGDDADEQALGTGVVDVFGPDGTLISRFATGSLSGGSIDSLVSPWGVAVAPANFADIGGDILIGNFSDENGFINIFDPSGNFLDILTMGGNPFNMPYLWAIGSRTGGPNVNPDALYITAGIGDEEDGLFAELLPVPEPSTWAMMLLGFGAMGLTFRGRDRRRTALAST
jgi:uncharacterized protein (TIGR03118 family)